MPEGGCDSNVLQECGCTEKKINIYIAILAKLNKLKMIVYRIIKNNIIIRMFASIKHNYMRILRESINLQ